MLIKVNHLVIRNIFTFRNEQKIIFSDQGIVRIHGDNQASVMNDSNGAGKTNILKSFLWAVTGKVIEQDKIVDIGDKVLNRTAKKDGMAKISLSVADKKVDIHRYRKDSQYGTSVRVFIDNHEEDISSKDMKDMQNRIEKILGIDSHTFIYLTVIKGSLPSFLSMSDSSIKKILEKTVGSQRFDDALDSARKKAKEVKEEIADLANSLTSLTKILEIALENKSDLKLSKDAFEDNRKDRLSGIEGQIRYLLSEEETVLREKEQVSKNLFTMRDRKKDIISNIEELKKEITESSNGFLEVKICQAQVSKMIDSSLGKIEILERDVENLDKKIKSKKIEERVRIEEDIEACDREIKEVELFIDGNKEKYENCLETIELMKKADWKDKGDINTAEKNLHMVQDRLENAESLIGSICENCGTLITEESLDHITKESEKEIDRLNETIKIKRDSLKEREEEKKEIEDFIKNYEESVTKKVDKMDKVHSLRNTLDNFPNIKDTIEEKKRKEKEILSIKDEVNELATDKEKFEKELKELLEDKDRIDFVKKRLEDLENEEKELLNKDNILIEKADNIKDKKIDLDKRLTEIRQENNPHILLLKKTEKTIAATEDDIKKVNADLSEKINDLKYYEFWIEGFSTTSLIITPLRAFLLDKIISKMNEILPEYSYIMSKGELSIDLSSTSKTAKNEVRDRIGVNIDNSKGADWYSGNSTGEINRIDLCTTFALRKASSLLNGVVLDILFLDEIDTNLDTFGLKALSELLLHESQSTGSIFVLTHRSDLANHLDKKWTVIKDKNGSRISENDNEEAA